MIFCDDINCKISIEPAAFVGCYFVIVDDDPEHPLNQSCISEQEAWEIAADVREEFLEDNGRMGVGA